jgi:hypothetical protein
MGKLLFLRGILNIAHNQQDTKCQIKNLLSMEKFLQGAQSLIRFLAMLVGWRKQQS